MIEYRTLGKQRYNTVWDYQKDWLQSALRKKQLNQTVDEKVLFVEHPHVYTLGKHADQSNMLINESFLKRIGAETYQIERGGDITYHGPGQLVVYPLLDLEQQKMGIKKYIFNLEQVLIDILNENHISANRIDGRTGIWIDKDLPEERKIAAIGIKSSRYLTIHGLAFNINTDLDFFNHIVPCGIPGKGVTSLSRELGKVIDMPSIINQFKKHFESYFVL